ncbi:MAG: N-acetyltransferase [Muribaculaceae bacterium]|nr:N-acetyltransferase [Bacteroides sp.]MDE6681184.1 N-acetyltransferase [Muribaculaceae bacterium]MDE6803493.1 N-acetyltransferase [Muribaculaceae bacterium]MDE7189712.1 N-acetyltransferase [Muribaculaceae bacterium]
MITIKTLEPTKSNLKDFTKFQIDLYDGNPYYVPPLISDDVATLDPATNPAFDFCESVYFMAYRDGKPVGRVAGMINRQVNENHNEKNARFGFIDFIDDHDVSAALMKAVEDWARSKGMKKIIGPLGFTDLDHEGMLVEGYEELSTMATIYNYPYYAEHLERLGYKKESDWVEFLMTVPDKIPDKYNRIAEIVKKKYGLRVLKYKSRSRIKKEYGRALFHLINEAYDGLYQYSHLTERQIDYYINIYLGLLNLDLVTLIVDKDNKLVGVGISMPSMSRALQKSRGRMFPIGWWHLLKGLKGANDRVDLLLVAVHPHYQNKGVNALLFQDLIPYYQAKGYKYAESNPEMETNSKVQSQWEYFEYRQHRRRRSFAKKL